MLTIHHPRYLVTQTGFNATLQPISCGSSKEHSAAVVFFAGAAQTWCINHANDAVTSSSDANQEIGAGGNAIGGATDVTIHPGRNMAAEVSPRFIIEVEWKHCGIAALRKLVQAYVNHVALPHVLWLYPSSQALTSYSTYCTCGETFVSHWFCFTLGSVLAGTSTRMATTICAGFSGSL